MTMSRWSAESRTPRAASPASDRRVGVSHHSVSRTSHLQPDRRPMKYGVAIGVALFVAGRLYKAYDDMMFYDWGFYE